MAERAPAAEKVAAVAEISAEFRDASAMVVTEYRGLTMSQITNLRRSLGSDVNYTVAKNTLVKRAAADAGVEGIELPDHPFFVATAFQPQVGSGHSGVVHPLIAALLAAAATPA